VESWVGHLVGVVCRDGIVRDIEMEGSDFIERRDRVKGARGVIYGKAEGEGLRSSKQIERDARV
jgi:hypothetical protein